MKGSILAVLLLAAALPSLVPLAWAEEEVSVILPAPKLKGPLCLEEAIFRRRSVRRFVDAPLDLPAVSQLLWAAGGKTIDGITGPTRAYPSAGAIYPLEIYLAAGKVRGLAPGVYRYRWEDHSLVLVTPGDVLRNIALASWKKEWMATAPVNIVFVGVPAKSFDRFGVRGEERYLAMDVGHAGQNLQLQAQALGLGSVVVGHFDDAAVAEAIGLPGAKPLYIIPVGKPLPTDVWDWMIRKVKQQILPAGKPRQ